MTDMKIFNAYYQLGYTSYLAGKPYQPPSQSDTTNSAFINIWAYDLGWETALKKFSNDLIPIIHLTSKGGTNVRT